VHQVLMAVMAAGAVLALALCRGQKKLGEFAGSG